MDQLEMSDACFQEFVGLIHRFTGITIQGNRKAMVQGRLRKRIRALSLGGYSEYLGFVKSNSEEHANFIDLVTTNETYFLRTPRIWEYLTQVYLQKWYQDHPGKVFQAWSAASSSGEEAHTLAILCEHFKSTHPGFQYQILATDISQEILGFAQKGLYQGRSIEAFRQAHPDLFQKYMVTEGEYFQVTPEIKSRMTFRLHNLFEKPKSNTIFDLILLRNVLIYFVAGDQEKVLKNVQSALSPTGQLIVGESETLAHIDTNFEFVAPLTYQRAA